MNTDTYSTRIVALQRAREAGEVEVTTDEAGLLIAHRVDPESKYDTLLAYNLTTRKSYVLIYRDLELLASHETNEPTILAWALCEKYRSI